MEENKNFEGQEQEQEVVETTINKKPLLMLVGLFIIFMIVLKFTLCSTPSTQDIIDEINYEDSVTMRNLSKTPINPSGEDFSSQMTQTSSEGKSAVRNEIKPIRKENTNNIQTFKYLISNGDILKENVKVYYSDNYEEVKVELGTLSTITLIRPQMVMVGDSVSFNKGNGFTISNEYIRDKSKRKVIMYRVRRGDTVSSILRKFNMSRRELANLNPYYNLDAKNPRIYTGQKLKVYE